MCLWVPELMTVMRYISEEERRGALCSLLIYWIVLISILFVAHRVIEARNKNEIDKYRQARPWFFSPEDDKEDDKGDDNVNVERNLSGQRGDDKDSQSGS